MERLHIHGWVCRCGLLGPEHVGSPVEELGLPLGDLVGMHIELLRQLGQGLLALHGGQGHFGLESRRVVPAGSLAHHFSCLAAILAALRQKFHSSCCANFPSQLSSPAGFLAFVLTRRTSLCRVLSYDEGVLLRLLCASVDDNAIDLQEGTTT